MPDPFGTPAAFFNSSEAGGVFVTKVNERSSKIVISTGMIVPAWLAVRSLYVFTNSMMLMPYWPSAGPPAAPGRLARRHCSFTIPMTFFAIDLPPTDSRYRCNGTPRRFRAASG